MTRRGPDAALAVALVRLVRVYQRRAPRSLRAQCRFYPSCSEYSILSIQKHGALRGSRAALARIRRCRPPHGGLDEP